MYVRTNISLGQVSPSKTELPLPAPRVLTYTTKDVIDQRISVPAQHALVRLSKNQATSVDAVAMLAEIKAERLGGIYCVNWKIPNQRAKRMGKSWGDAIPKGEDAVLMLDPDNPINGVPLIAFRRELDPRPKQGCGLLPNEKPFPPSPARLDAALLKAWASYRLWQTGRLAPCNTGPSSIPVGNVVPPGFCWMRGQKKTPPMCSVGLPTPTTGTSAALLTFDTSKKYLSRCTNVEPKLCFHQVQKQPSTRLSEKELQEHRAFTNCANNHARRICALASPTNFPLNFRCLSSCTELIGAAPYVSGEHIIQTLVCASQCLQAKINEVHIFGHSGRIGIFGSLFDYWCGLYVNSKHLDSSDRKCGGRKIDEIPTHVLADDVVFILHGCNTANSSGMVICDRARCQRQPPQGPSFAEELSVFLHRSGLSQAKVYGHPKSINIGANSDWVEFPSGKAIVGRLGLGPWHFCA